LPQTFEVEMESISLGKIITGKMKSQQYFKNANENMNWLVLSRLKAS